MVRAPLALVQSPCQRTLASTVNAFNCLADPRRNQASVREHPHRVFATTGDAHKKDGEVPRRPDRKGAIEQIRYITGQTRSQSQFHRWWRNSA